MTGASTQVQYLRDAAFAHYRRGDFQTAERLLREALKIEPLSVELWNNLGTAQASAKRSGAALLSFERALQLAPNFSAAAANRANTQFALQRYAEAIPGYEAVLRHDPNHPYALGNLLFCKLQCGDWTNADELRTLALAQVQAGKRAVTPALTTALLDKPADQYRALQILARDKFPPVPPLWRGERYRHDRIRVAYLSADFHAHATATLMAGIFDAHDRRRFETVAISYGPDDGSGMRARITQGFGRFHDVKTESDADIAALMRREEIDIAVDLKGYTSDARPAILSHRPAPVQVNYLGFPATMAANFMDYLLADRFVVPPEHEAFYAEKLVRLPHSYQPNDGTRPIGVAPARVQAGLPETGFVFCCFNNSFKILPLMFDIWMRLLHDIGGSVLWLLDDNAASTANLRREAATRGIAPERLVFTPRAKLEDHLARQRLADLFLDTLPYNAHTTASDALWAGLPVLTCMGGTFAGRVAASVLNAAGLPELATANLEEYEALALALARDPTRLAAIKAKLAQNRETSPLFDAALFTHHLESAYETMWERAQRGEKPSAFDVPAIAATAPG